MFGRLRGQDTTIHPGHLPMRSFRWRACPSTRPGEPPVAGTSMGRWGRTRRLAHLTIGRPGLHQSARPMDWTKKGRETTTTLGCAGLSPTVLPSPYGTGDVLMSRLREGRANTARHGAAHFLRETVGRVRYGGASGQLTVRADSASTPSSLSSPSAARWRVCFAITIRQHKGLRELIEAIPEQDWTPIPLLDGRRRRCGRDHPIPPSRVIPAPRRVRTHRPAGEGQARFPVGALRLRLSRLHHRPPGRLAPGTGGRSSRHAEIENAIRDLKHGVGLNHLPSGRFAANRGPGWRCR